VADEDNHSILKFTPDGTKSTFAWGLSPYDVAFDSLGNLFVSVYVGDAGSSILKFTPDGKKSTFASGLGYLDHPTCDDKGNLFVRNWDSHSIFKFTPKGVKSTFASGLNEPFDLAFDRSGNVFVTQEVSPSILKFTADGKKSTFDTGIKPYGMALDAAGNLLVLEYGVT
jgi:DNA-binding beta-propeller fold protein YncE